jgi:hypothetical protein
VGLFLLNETGLIPRMLTDESHEVRIMAAWALIKSGERDKGYACLENLMKNRSYALLTVLNAVDWMEPDGEPLMPTVTSLDLTTLRTNPKKECYEERMRSNLYEKYGNH